MKCSFIKLSLSIFLMFMFLFSYTKGTSSVSKFSMKAKNVLFNEAEAKSLSVFAKYANCGSKPLKQTCMECLNPAGGFKMFFFYQFTRMKKYNYKFFIHYNDSTKQVVISFGGPSVENHNYVKWIYSRGFSLVKLYNIQVEKEFRTVYIKKLRKVLLEKVKKMKASGRLAYKFYFVGYSVGGSLATLSAFDLTKSGVLKHALNHPTVYTYGGLRIGDAKFVALINSTVQIWRIVKQDDFIVRIPNCYYSTEAKIWRCFTRPILRRYIFKRNFPLTLYYKRYINSTSSPLGKLLMLRRQPNNLHHGMTLLESSIKQINRITNHHRQWTIPRTVPRGSLSNDKNILVRTYYKNIYYTQPIGREIYYNPAMTTYRTCNYIDGVSSCEKIVNLPTSFTSLPHNTYFSINFDQCK